jgi:thiopeptide-type bacteriocin biosynthesis protein
LAFHLVSRFLLRAPLLPVRAARRPVEALRTHPLGADAVALASADLAAALERGGPAATAALARYGRRASFRPTPHGLLAGVGVGSLGARTSLSTAEVKAHLRPSWAALASLGRSLLDEPEVRASVRLRVTPSLLADGSELAWLAWGPDGQLEVQHAEADEPLIAVLEAAQDWALWPEVGDDDEYLMMLVEQGLLHHDLAPPLVGPEPLAWMIARLEPLRSRAAVAAREALLARPSGLAELRRSLQALPRSQDVHATLVHEGQATLSRAAVARAAALAPLLFRLQEALAPPASERALSQLLAERLEGITEIYGAGAFDLDALAGGGYGVTLTELDEPAPAQAPPPVPLLAHLVELLTAAARDGAEEIVLDPATLDTLLPPGAPPPTFELVLTPARPPRPRAAPGEDWLLGLHGPAGASWGRFAHVLPELAGALQELHAAEVAARPGEHALDVTFAPSVALADLCVHPAVRDEALALVSWPARGGLRPADLALVVEPGAPDPLALRSADAEPVRPSPLHRVRSTTAPGGVYRLLAGWSLVRQHAPWAFSWGALAGLPRLPRVRLGGFVVAPASWRLPLESGAGLPRHVQVGQEDELLLVDRRSPEAARDLSRGRAFEVWPPLDDLPDQGGRRVEAVVAVVSDQGPPIDGVIHAGPVLPAVPAPGFTTYKLFGAEEHQDLVLVETIGPVVAEALGAGEIDRWWFLRYVDGPGRRDHLRLRVHSPGDPGLFAARLRAALAPARAAGDVVAVETSEYFPERARYGAALSDVERLFELDSELCLRLLSHDLDRLDLSVRVMDALLRGLGLDLEARRRVAEGRRAAVQVDRGTLDRILRTRQRHLSGLLAGTVEDEGSDALDGHATRVRALVAERPLGTTPELIAALPAVLHVGCVRLLGARPDDEAAAYFFWERTLAGLAARRRQSS